MQYSLAQEESQLSPSFGSNDTAHFSKKKYNRSHLFKKVKEVWTRGRKHSKMGGFKKKVKTYPSPSRIS